LCLQISLGCAEEARSKEPEQSTSTQTANREQWVGAFAQFPGSRLLCQQHIAGTGPTAPHIVWYLYATDRPPNEVHAFYADHPGTEPSEFPAEVQLRVGKKVLAVYAASGREYPRCGVEPQTTDKTVIVISDFISSEP
jgi:hypothetical protein